MRRVGRWSVISPPSSRVADGYWGHVRRVADRDRVRGAAGIWPGIVGLARRRLRFRAPPRSRGARGPPTRTAAALRGPGRPSRSNAWCSRWWVVTSSARSGTTSATECPVLLPHMGPAGIAAPLVGQCPTGHAVQPQTGLLTWWDVALSPPRYEERVRDHVRGILGPSGPTQGVAEQRVEVLVVEATEGLVPHEKWCPSCLSLCPVVTAS